MAKKDFVFGGTLDPDQQAGDQLYIAWLNSYAITTASLVISGCVLQFKNASGSVLSSFILAPKV